MFALEFCVCKRTALALIRRAEFCNAVVRLRPNIKPGSGSRSALEASSAGRELPQALCLPLVPPRSIIKLHRCGELSYTPARRYVHLSCASTSTADLQNQQSCRYNL